MRERNSIDELALASVWLPWPTSWKPALTLATSLAVVLVFGLPALAGGPPVHECDRLAAHPDDPQKVADGVVFEAIETERAIGACEAALTEFPGTPRFEFQLGRTLDAAGQENLAVDHYRVAAEQGHPAAQHSLFLSYAEGTGVDQDPAEAAKWLERAAVQGVVPAQTSLGLAYSRGFGVAQDDTRAAEWFRKAAEGGSAHAQGYLADAYSEGRGVPQDYTEAIKWLRKSEEQGLPEAQNDLAILYWSGLGTAQDQSKALALFQSAADQGLPEAQHALGAIYERGEHVPQDNAKAVKWFRRAAQKGHANAQDALARHYLNGTGVTKDENEAAKWFQMAADKGLAKSQFSLGLIFWERRDYHETFRWLRRAAEQGHEAGTMQLMLAIMTAFPTKEGDGYFQISASDGAGAFTAISELAKSGNHVAQAGLAQLYKDGLGDVVSKDREKAIFWYRKVVAQGEPGFTEILEELEAQ